MDCGNAALDAGSRFPAAVFGEDRKRSDSVSAFLCHFLLLQPPPPRVSDSTTPPDVVFGRTRNQSDDAVPVPAALRRTGPSLGRWSVATWSTQSVLNANMKVEKREEQVPRVSKELIAAEEILSNEERREGGQEE